MQLKHGVIKLQASGLETGQSKADFYLGGSFAGDKNLLLTGPGQLAVWLPAAQRFGI